MRNSFFLQSLVAFAFVACQGALAAADTVRSERLTLSDDGRGTAITSSIRVGERLRYELAVVEGDTLSVDLLSRKADVHFTIRPADSDYSMHSSALDGTVADIVVPESGDYLVDVFIEQDDKTVSKSADAVVTISRQGPALAQQLAQDPEFWAVTGLKEGALLNLRAGPSTRYPTNGQLASGEPLQNNGCRLTRGERWCFVRVPRMEISGWVSGRFLVEG